jgi:hypothetical protein
VCGSHLVHEEESLPRVVLRPGSHTGKRYTPSPGEELDGLSETQLLIEHDELERVATRLTAEAVEELKLGVHGERRGLLVVEGAEALEPSSALLQRYVLGHEADDVTRVPDRRDEILRERNGQAATSIEAGAARAAPARRNRLSVLTTLLSEALQELLASRQCLTLLLDARLLVVLALLDLG